jgi:hypothetical protein
MEIVMESWASEGIIGLADDVTAIRITVRCHGEYDMIARTVDDLDRLSSDRLPMMAFVSEGAC